MVITMGIMAQMMPEAMTVGVNPSSLLLVVYKKC